ncbi:MAG: pyridoxamine 5'-phosphate oxidase family protein [Pirellulales bacterium]
MTVAAHDDRAVQRLGELIKDIRIAMFTTVGLDGALHSRPMATQQTPFDGELWFFTKGSSLKVDELEEHRRVNLSYADPSHQRYVSVSGTASVFRDRGKEEELWNPLYKAWFPDGLDDPDLMLLRVTVEEAEYWDAPSNSMMHIIGFVKALVTGKEYEPGEHGELELPPR